MSAMLGDFLVRLSAPHAPTLPERCRDAARWPRTGGGAPEVRVAAPAAGVEVAACGAVRIMARGDRGGIGLAREPQHGGAADTPEAATDRALRAWLDDPTWTPAALRGRHVFVFWDAGERRITAFTDAFRTYPLYHEADADGLTCASDLRLMLLARSGPPRADRTALYHYLNFAYVPSPGTAVEGISKLPPGFRLDGGPGQARVGRASEIRYPEDLDGPDDVRAAELRERIVSTVTDYRPAPGEAWGTFLSGGTDSSSISGILARGAPGSVDSFSIGFDESGFDEMSYSRLAAERLGLRPHERRVGEADAVAVVERLAVAFDEPFGNASAIPTYYCAAMAREAGKSLLVAGDGGDEIFGGNERYAKDQVFGWYHRAPGPVRALGRGLARALGGTDAHFANRLRNMVRRGELPNPDRFYTDDSFASDHYEALLAPDFRAAVRPDASLQIQRELFARADARSELHRLMYLDLKLTIAESDLVKVLRATRLAGVDVAFPYIDRELVAYTGRLPARFKVRGLDKRYLFKLAMADILPVEIRRKKKQGFGLPTSVWLRQGGPLRDLVHDVVLSPRALGRGLFDAPFIRELALRHERGAWDHSSEIIRLLMLELWQREFLDAR